MRHRSGRALLFSPWKSSNGKMVKIRKKDGTSMKNYCLIIVKKVKRVM